MTNIMKHTRRGRVFTEIVLEIFKVNGLLAVEGDQLTKDQGLSSARWKILGALKLSDQPLTVPQIARLMGQTRQGVQRLTDLLEKDRLLLYQNNPNHKRAKLVTLTPKGHKAYSILNAKQIPWANQSANNISTAELQATLSVLKNMAALFEH